MDSLAYRETIGYQHIDYDDAPVSLPNELLEQIISEGWNSPMSPTERINFMASTFLVSKAWLATLARISAADVYIPSSSYLTYYRRLGEGQSLVYQRLLPETCPLKLCRSITRQIPLSSQRCCHISHPDQMRGKPIRDLLSTFHILPYLPNLRTMSIEYCFSGFMGKNQDFHQFLSFHVPILQLNLEYRFSSREPAWLVDALSLSGQQRRLSKQKHVPWALPYLEHISTMSEDNIVGDILELCPHLELPDEEFNIKVQVVSSSQRVPNNSAIIHTGLSSPIGREERGIFKGKDGSKIVRGCSLGFVLEIGATRIRHWHSTPLDLTDRPRTVHLFVRRSG